MTLMASIVTWDATSIISATKACSTSVVSLIYIILSCCDPSTECFMIASSTITITLPGTWLSLMPNMTTFKTIFTTYKIRFISPACDTPDKCLCNTSFSIFIKSTISRKLFLWRKLFFLFLSCLHLQFQLVHLLHHSLHLLLLL